MNIRQLLKSLKLYQLFIFISLLLSYQRTGTAQQTLSDGLENGRDWEAFIGIILVIIVISMLMIQSFKNKRLTRKLEKLATTDDLTGLTNKRYILENVETQLNNVKNVGGDLCIALVDIDWFRQINDKFGYFTGDKVLKLFSELCIENLSDDFLLGRIGEEEFLILMPDTHRDKAYLALEHLRITMNKVSEKVNMPDLEVTLSAGICEYKQNDTSDIMLQLASMALYRAKENSKNIVVLCDRSVESNL